MEYNVTVTVDEDQIKGREEEIKQAIIFSIHGAMHNFRDGGPMGNSRASQLIDYEVMTDYHEGEI